MPLGGPQRRFPVSPQTARFPGGSPTLDPCHPRPDHPNLEPLNSLPGTLANAIPDFLDLAAVVNLHG
jgi:hypothetical protein